MSDINLDAIVRDLKKAIEAGGYNQAPTSLVQGSALQVENLDSVIQNVCIQESDMVLRNSLESSSVKSTLVQFDRQLSYGQLGGSARREGQLGIARTSDFVRAAVPMAFYSESRRVTLVADAVATVDGVSNSDRAAKDAAMALAMDIEFDCFQGCANFTLAASGIFDGNPSAIPDNMANMRGLDVQVRESDTSYRARDLMFASYGANNSIVLEEGGVLSQTTIQDASTATRLNNGRADKLMLATDALGNYTKLAFGKERIVLAGSGVTSTGSDLSRQVVSGGEVSLVGSRFLVGKTRPLPPVLSGPASPTLSIASATVAGITTNFQSGEVYQYLVSAVSQEGESLGTAGSVTVTTTGQVINVTITPVGALAQWFEVYRSVAGGTNASAKFIGRVKANGTTAVVFRDIGGMLPGASTAYLVQTDTMKMASLMPFSRQKMAITDLSQVEAFFSFECILALQPRKSVIIANVQ